MSAKVPFLDLARHVAAIRPQLDDAIAEVVESGWFIFGPPVERFESAFADYCGVGHAIGVANGTDAVTVALQAVGVGRGDEVITAANTCVPTIVGILATGATPVLVDVDATTQTIDPARVAEAISGRTRAIVPVHLYGRCADMDALGELADEHELRIVEDAAQAHGATYHGKRAGALGDAAAFSFYPTKNLGALGDGGAVVTDRADVAEQARLLRNYGERDRYESLQFGWNSRLDAVQAAVLAAKLPLLDGWVARRREIASAYREALAEAPIDLPQEQKTAEHAYHLFVVTVADRERFRQTLADAGVETLVHYPRPIHEHPAYVHLSREDGALGESERLSQHVVSLPLYPELRESEIERVIEASLQALAARA